MLNEVARQIVETVPDALMILDQSLQLQVANRSFYHMFQVSAEDSDGRFLYDLGKGEWNSPDLRRLLQDLLPQNKIVENFEVEHNSPALGLRVLLVNARRVDQPEASNNLILVIVQDITERRRIERALELQAQDLARSNADLQQFAYVASHDLQEPLRMITNYLKLIERRYKGKLDTNADEFIAFAVDGATRMQVLIDDLLAYARIGTKGSPFVSVNCETILQYTLENLEIAIAERDGIITHDPLPTVVGDSSQLAQVFQNLIGNAMKFQREKPALVHVSAEQTETEWLFSVRDNGLGIEPEFHERIFVIFQRLHRREDYSGTGIGLAICKRIIERHGGRIWVESQLGQGTIFYFTIPVRSIH